MIGSAQENAADCLRCGACCRVPGYVHVTATEVEALAAHLEMTVSEFTVRYTRLTRERAGLSLTEMENGACVFLEHDGTCRVHAAKPAQCRMFPGQWRFRDFKTICSAEQMKQQRYSADTDRIPGRSV